MHKDLGDQSQLCKLGDDHAGCGILVAGISCFSLSPHYGTTATYSLNLSYSAPHPHIFCYI